MRSPSASLICSACANTSGTDKPSHRTSTSPSRLGSSPEPSYSPATPTAGPIPAPRVTIRAAIVDDEPPARALLRKLLEAHPEIEIAGESGNASDAIALLRHARPDLLFLDIRMPAGDGF